MGTKNAATEEVLPELGDDAASTADAAAEFDIVAPGTVATEVYDCAMDDASWTDRMVDTKR